LARRKTKRSGRVKIAKDVAEFVRRERVCRVATTGRGGMPHLVPVCHVFEGGRLYIGSGHDGRKVRNVTENPRMAVAVDLYSEHWKQLKGVLLQGTSRVIAKGPEFRRARGLLYAKYPQYEREAALDESDSVIVELTPTHVFTWGF
jgi:PPOX class probable F420-dependent enzyme